MQRENMGLLPGVGKSVFQGSAHWIIPRGWNLLARTSYITGLGVNDRLLRVTWVGDCWACAWPNSLLGAEGYGKKQTSFCWNGPVATWVAVIHRCGVGGETYPEEARGGGCWDWVWMEALGPWSMFPSPISLHLQNTNSEMKVLRMSTQALQSIKP